MRVCWATDKAILNQATGTLAHHPAGTPFEMPDEEAEDRIRQGDCMRYVEPGDRPADGAGESATGAENEPAPPLPPVPPPGAQTGQQIQEG